jgi:hypothetical protein
MRIGLLLTATLGLTHATRDVIIQNSKWTNSSTGSKIILTGANVVMKGDPWIPAVQGDNICDVSYPVRTRPFSGHDKDPNHVFYTLSNCDT